MPTGGSRDAGLSASDLRFTVAELLDSRMRRQYDRFLALAHPEIVFHSHSWREGLLAPDVWQGTAALRQLFRRTDEVYFPEQHEILDILVDADGAGAAVRWRGDWRRHDNSRVYTNDAAHFLRFENGRVVEMHEFFDAQCVSAPNCGRAASFETLLTPQPAGLDRAEMARRAHRLLTFPSGSPEPELVRQWFSPNVVCEFVGDRARLPYAGRHTGLEALLGVIRAIHVDFEQRPLAASDFLIEDGRGACWRQVNWRHRGTGRAGVSELADFVRFENGLIVELIEFRDTVSLLRMQD